MNLPFHFLNTKALSYDTLHKGSYHNVENRNQGHINTDLVNIDLLKDALMFLGYLHTIDLKVLEKLCYIA